MKPSAIKYLVLIVTGLAFLAGCDNKDEFNEMTMRRQEKYGTQTPGEFFPDDMASRSPVDHTVSTDPPAPRPPVTLQLVQRGQQRFDIYCSMCHGQDGYGQGMVVQHGFPQPPSYHSDRVRNMTDDHLYRVISDGLGKMPPYAAQIAPEDRWAIVSYVRALQRSQYAKISDVPADQVSSIEEGAAR